MKLRDFELCVSNFNKDNEKFNMLVRCLIAHFFKYYKNIDTDKVKKIIIEFEEKGANYYSRSDMEVPLYENVLGIATLRREFDFKKYWSLSDVNRKEYAFREFVDGIKEVCAKENIDSTYIDDVAKLIESDNYNYQGYWKKRAISNPSKNKSARIFFKYLSNVIEIYAEVKHENTEIQLTLIEEISPPYLHEFVNAFGRLFWDSDSVLVLEKKKGGKQVKLVIG